MKWKLSTFKSLTNTKSTTIEADFNELCKSFTTPWKRTAVKDKKDLPLWSPTTFKNGRRSGKNAEYIYFLVFDIDDGLTPFSTWRLFYQWDVIAHTSFSHRPHHHKYRIILPLKKPVPAQHWDRASQAGNDLWNEVVGRGEPDQSALHDRARAFFRYGIPHSETYVMAHHPMAPLDYHQTAWSVGQKGPLELEYEHIRVKERRKETVVSYKTPKKYRNGKAAMNEVMLTSPFRLAMASKLGGNIQGNEVRYITCPGCGQNSVHYSIDLGLPCSTKWPQCNHKNKCAWWGKFEDLI